MQKKNNNKPLLETQVGIQNWLLNPNNWTEDLFMNIVLHVMCKHLNMDRIEKRFWSCFHMEGHISGVTLSL